MKENRGAGTACAYASGINPKRKRDPTMKTFTSAALIALCLGLSACDSMPRIGNAEIGAVTGAVAGGLAGSALTHGSTVGTVVGAGAGAAAGHEIGRREQ